MIHRECPDRPCRASMAKKPRSKADRKIVVDGQIHFVTKILPFGRPWKSWKFKKTKKSAAATPRPPRHSGW